MLELIVMVGVPGSGKTTYAKKHYPSYMRVNNDDNARLHFGVNFDPRLREPLENLERIIILGNFELSNSVVADSTNINEAAREKYLRYAYEFSEENPWSRVKTIAVYIPLDLDEANARNNERNEKARIPLGIIERYFNKLAPPTKEEGFDEVIVV